MAAISSKFDSNDPDAVKRMRAMFSPQMVDQQIRQAVHFCWMMLPPEKQTVDEVEKQLRRIVDRAVRDMREDAVSFGLGQPPEKTS